MKVRLLEVAEENMQSHGQRAKSDKVDKIYCTPGKCGNCGICGRCVPIGVMEFDKIVAAVAKEK